MLDIRWIRETPEQFTAAMQKRGVLKAGQDSLTTELLETDRAFRELITQQQQLQSRRNQMAKEIGMAKKNGENADGLMEESKRINDQLAELDARIAEGNPAEELLKTLPNRLDDSVPLAEDESANKEVKRWGKAPTMDFEPKLHDDVGEALGMMDFEVAAKIAGSRFVVLKQGLARLERALAAFMLDIHTAQFGFTEVVPPYLVRDASLYGTGQLPKFAEDLFKTTSGHWLIPTAEVSLTNLVQDSIVPEGELPLRYTAWTPCFRSEAGAAGRDTRGMIRQHQFSKVELVSICAPEKSEEEHQLMLTAAETILQKLGLHYRVMLLCSGDTGFCSQKTFDLEVWLPGQQAFREISSVSNCGDFQARRMKARLKGKEGGPRLLHTLNGSGLAVGRTMVAILENYQQADGSVRIPEVLVPYMGGVDKLAAA
jgi:seryl-tRNA synthetase